MNEWSRGFHNRERYEPRHENGPSIEEYFQRLGLLFGASEEDVKSAFRRLAKECHPDLKPNDSDAEQRFKEINEANETLKNYFQESPNNNNFESDTESTTEILLRDPEFPPMPTEIALTNFQDLSPVQFGPGSYDLRKYEVQGLERYEVLRTLRGGVGIECFKSIRVEHGLVVGHASNGFKYFIDPETGGHVYEGFRQLVDFDTQKGIVTVLDKNGSEREYGLS